MSYKGNVHTKADIPPLPIRAKRDTVCIDDVRKVGVLNLWKLLRKYHNTDNAHRIMRRIYRDAGQARAYARGFAAGYHGGLYAPKADLGTKTELAYRDGWILARR